ncbi:MAG TPA: thioredoxin domain-containing protein [Kofleriaceae bacterium]|nr:thioredoxin domain-containing protein [Kofleriaceae bacterium]
MLRLDTLGTYVHATHPDTDDVVGRGTIDITHDQRIFLEESRLSIALGLPRGFGLSLVVPVRVFSTTIRYEDASGAVVQLANPGIHHRDETLVGLGDPILLGSITRTIGAWRVTARAGASLPLGRTQPNPFVLGDEGLAHEHFQMGTGTIEPVAALEVSRAWLRAYAFTQQASYEDSYGYRAGDRYAAGVELRRALDRAWSVTGGLALQDETAEHWRDTPDPSEGNLGRVDVMIDAGASWAASRDVSFDLDVKVPIYTHVVGGQLDMPAIVSLGASWSFGRPTAPKIEHAEGKTTIVDYWATWCAPCKVLEPRLEALARDHADHVELRRVDLTDVDSALELPHVTVYDPSGATVLDRSAEGDLASLYGAIEAAIGEAPPPPATHVEIHVTDLGFEPSNVVVPAGVPVEIVITRDSEASCATSVVIAGTRYALPLHERVTIHTTFARGAIAYACGMNMLHGTITAE